MKRCMRSKLFKNLCLFILGGLLYNLIEVIWRGRTHWSMFLVGGTCFQFIGRIYRTFKHSRLILRCLLSSVAVTAIEFVSGCLFNLHWKMRVWDYTDLPLNIAGQVCLLYSVFWAALSIPAGWLHRLCDQKWQHLH